MLLFLKEFKSLLLFSKVGAAALKCLEPDSCTESVRKVVRKYPKGVKVFVLSYGDVNLTGRRASEMQITYLR